MSTFVDDMSLADARRDLQKRTEVGVVCPCCGQFAKVYKRRINAGMAYGLLLFFKRFGWDKRWVHIPSETDLSRLGGDWAKLALWGLVEEQPSVHENGGHHPGWWRITDQGVAFVLGRVRVPRFLLIYNGAVQHREVGETISVRDALANKFDYVELMRGVARPAADCPELVARKPGKIEQMKIWKDD